MNLEPEAKKAIRNLGEAEREHRIQEAEKIRQEFVKSKRLPLPPHLKPPEEENHRNEL